MRCFLVEAGILNRTAHLMANDGKQRLLVLAVTVGFAMLDVHHAGNTSGRRNNRNRDERLVAVLRQRIEECEPAVLARMTRNCNLLGLLGHPSGNSLSNFYGN